MWGRSLRSSDSADQATAWGTTNTSPRLVYARLNKPKETKRCTSYCSSRAAARARTTTGTISSSIASGRRLGPGYEVRYPRMPDESDPSYLRWKQAIESACAELEDGAILVGHSVGATILVNAIAEDPPRIALGGIFLDAAPFVGEGGWPSGDGLEPRENSVTTFRRVPPSISIMAASTTRLRRLTLRYTQRRSRKR